MPRKRTSTEDETQHGPTSGAADHDQCSQVKIPQVSQPDNDDSDDAIILSVSAVDPLAKERSSEDPMPTNMDSDNYNSNVAPSSREPNATYDHYHTTGDGHSLDIGPIKSLEWRSKKYQQQLQHSPMVKSTSFYFTTYFPP